MDIRRDARPVVSFAKLESVMPMPNLLDVQLRSFEKLVQQDVDPKEQWDFGLDRVFAEIFPISDVNENFTLEYVTAALGEPKYSVEECIERDMTYAAPLKATLRLVVWERPDEEGEGEKRPGDIIEKEVYLGDLPLLTELGTFIINGAERVVVSQLHRSPGVVFEENIHPNGSKLHSARIIPFRGSWVEFSIDINHICYVHIDKKKKFPATALLRAFGFGTDADIYQLFFTTKTVNPMAVDKQGNKEILGNVLAEEIVDRATGEVLVEESTEVDEDVAELLERAGRKKVKTYTSGQETGRESPIIKNTLRKDPTESEEEALSAIYSLLRPGDAPNMETARAAIEHVFFNPKRYDLGRVGRYKINKRLGLKIPAHKTVLTKEDFIEILRYLIELSEGRGSTDDIDHLGNRRVRTVGELIANQFSVGLSRMARLVKERMSINTDPEKINIDDLVNARTVSAVIQAFLRFVPAQPVHGPDEPAGRDDAQTTSLRSGSGWPDTGTCRVRGEGRTLLPLRADVSDRDAGGPEHRPHHVTHDVQPHQRARLRRNAVPAGCQQKGHGQDRLAFGQRRGGGPDRSGQCSSGFQGELRQRVRSCVGSGVIFRCSSRTSSTTWTLRRTSLYRWRRR